MPLTQCVPKVLDEKVQRFFPADRLKRSLFTAAYHRRGSPPSAVVRHPAIFAFWTQVTKIDWMTGIPPYTDDAAVLDGYVKTATVGAKQTGRVHPFVWFTINSEVDIRSGQHNLLCTRLWNLPSL